MTHEDYIKFCLGIHNYSFIEIQPCSLIYMLSCFHTTKAETLWPTKPKIFNIWGFKEKVSWLFGQAKYLAAAVWNADGDVSEERAFLQFPKHVLCFAEWGVKLCCHRDFSCSAAVFTFTRAPVDSTSHRHSDSPERRLIPQRQIPHRPSALP